MFLYTIPFKLNVLVHNQDILIFLGFYQFQGNIPFHLSLMLLDLHVWSTSVIVRLPTLHFVFPLRFSYYLYHICFFIIVITIATTVITLFILVIILFCYSTFYSNFLRKCTIEGNFFQVQNKMRKHYSTFTFNR